VTTSGTADLNFDILDICEEAYERAGSQMRSGYDLKTARRSINIMMMEWANMGYNLWTVDQQTALLTEGVNVIELDADTVDVLDMAIRTGSGTTQVDYTINRISEPTWLQIPAKTQTGRPLQYYVNRGTDLPTLYLWPVPDGNGPYTLYYFRLRRIEDVTGATQTMDMPFRLLPALIAGLAWNLSLKKQGVDKDRIVYLEQQYQKTLEMAFGEDREKASLFVAPYISYT